MSSISRVAVSVLLGAATGFGVQTTSWTPANAASFKFSAFSQSDYQGRLATYSSFGTHRPGFTISSWIWETDGVSVLLCRGGTAIARYASSVHWSTSTSGVNKVVIAPAGAQAQC
jgi:hypothetical protein